MIISPTNPVASTQGSGGALGKDEFLQLLVTQLRHQDPLSPLDAAQFASQLAQFSTLEQMVQLNDNFELQSQSLALMNLSMNTNLAASLVGRQVIAQGNQVVVSSSGQATVTVDVNGVGGRASVRVMDVNGSEVGVFSVGNIGGGRQTIPLDGLHLAPGVYRYEVTVTGTDDIPVHVTHFATGVVDGVQFADGGILLRAGDLLIPLALLVEIEAGPAAGDV